MKRLYWQFARNVSERMSLPPSARAERRRDRVAGATADPGSLSALDATIDWLCRAQDASRSGEGGVARDFSLLNGWSTSYPETTGYAIPTLIEYANRFGRPDIAERARRMADWLVSIQLPGGGFQGGRIDSQPVVPVTFNTGQILIGLAAAERAFGGYRDPMRAAADWLVSTQDADGCWRRFPSPFTEPGDKAYDTHVAWGLCEAARVEPDRGYQSAALANARWAITRQRPNGWIGDCCLDEPQRPLTHTLGYALRGFLEVHRITEAPDVLAAALRTADGLLSTLGPDGRLPGRLRSDWTPGVRWACLTGIAQIAACWLILAERTGAPRYAAAASAANRYVRSTVRVDGPVDLRGGVKGAMPVDGDYFRYAYPNWAAKFLADSLMREMELADAAAGSVVAAARA
jgi:hypothetical protein